jgi:hypothetical protein
MIRLCKQKSGVRIPWLHKDSLSGDALIAEADEIAERAHRGQIDKIGQPYINHPRRVAGRHMWHPVFSSHLGTHRCRCG